MGNFDEAVEWICPKCGAMNRPHATIIEKQHDGTAVCGQCAHAWVPGRAPNIVRPAALALLVLALALPAAAQIPIDQVQVFASPTSPQVRSWPATAQITDLKFTPAGVHVAFTKQDGPDRWPDVVPPGWTGPLQYTLWLVLNVNGQWCASGIIEYWHGLEAGGGNVVVDNQIARNWVYDGRWGPMAGHQPAVGEHVGFFVTAGDQRGKDVHQVAERSSIIEIEWPASTGAPRVVWTEGALATPPVFTPPPPVVAPPPAPEPLPAPVPVLTSLDLSPLLNQMSVFAAQQAEQLRQVEVAIRADIKSLRDTATNAFMEALKYIGPAVAGILAGMRVAK